jgi:broad-specificity NMP kinase
VGCLLLNRGYAEKKLSENVECEIMHVIAQEAMESYRYVQSERVFNVQQHSKDLPGCVLTLLI